MVLWKISEEGRVGGDVCGSKIKGSVRLYLLHHL